MIYYNKLLNRSTWKRTYFELKGDQFRYYNGVTII